MQGYDAGGEVRYGLPLTLFSLVLGVAGMALGAVIVLMGDNRLHRGLGAMVGVYGVASMHFLRIAALELPERVIGWDPVLPRSAVAGGLHLALLTAAGVDVKSPLCYTEACNSRALCIVCPHYTDVSALTVWAAAATETTLGPPFLASTMPNALAVVAVAHLAVGGALAWMGCFT